MNTFLRALIVVACLILVAIPVGGWVMLVIHSGGWTLAILSVFQLMLTVLSVAASVAMIQMVWDMTKKEG